VSPTSPTFGALNDQLTKAHHRIRELEAHETELLAQIRTLCAAIDPTTKVPDHRKAGNMTATIESTAIARTRQPAIGTLRLPLKPAHQACGCALQRWESDGGAVHPAPQSQTYAG
jgi:hypothetical protein